MINIKNQKEKGLSIILALLVLSSVLAIALGASSIVISEIKFNRITGDSVPAFFAADSGIEKVLTLRDNPQIFSDCVSEASSCVLDNGAEFWVEVTPAGGSCSADNFCIKSTGIFNNTKRAIEINY